MSHIECTTLHLSILTKPSVFLVVHLLSLASTLMLTLTPQPRWSCTAICKAWSYEFHECWVTIGKSQVCVYIEIPLIIFDVVPAEYETYPINIEIPEFLIGNTINGLPQGRFWWCKAYWFALRYTTIGTMILKVKLSTLITVGYKSLSRVQINFTSVVLKTIQMILKKLGWKRPLKLTLFI